MSTGDIVITKVYFPEGPGLSSQVQKHTYSLLKCSETKTIFFPLPDIVLFHSFSYLLCLVCRNQRHKTRPRKKFDTNSKSLELSDDDEALI